MMIRSIPVFKQVVLVGGLFLFCACTNAEEQHKSVPLLLEVFYSNEDPTWPAVKRIIDETLTQYPILKAERTAIDTPEGYAKLTQAEARLGIKSPGEITLLLGPIYLISKGQDRAIEKYLTSTLTRVFNPGEGKGRIELEPHAFAKEMFGEDLELKPVLTDSPNGVRYFAVKRAAQTLGYVADVYKPIQCPLCNDTQYLMALSATPVQILAIVPVRPIELMGKPLPPEKSEILRKQLIANAKDSAQPVDAVSGATRTIKSYEQTIELVLKSITALSP